MINFTFNATNLTTIPNDPIICESVLDPLLHSLHIKAIVVLFLMFIIFNIYLYFYGNKDKRTKIQRKLLDNLIIPYYILFGFLLAYLLFLL